ncbi:MAG: tetratricopeptide repeat protein [Myxococcales bacterium]|nr:tetratricopeptide repeat protein [Myxococcales bacterium]
MAVASVASQMPRKLAICLVFAAFFSVGAGRCGQDVQPEKSRTRVDLARDLLAKGDDLSAEVEVQRALALDAENEEAWNLWGLIYVVRAGRNANTAEVEQCLEETPEGDSFGATNDELMRKADEKLARATTLAPDYGDAWGNRAGVALHFRDWEAAGQLAFRALENLARLPVQGERLARANLGWASYQQGEVTKATTALLQALQGDPRFCLAAYRLAEVYFDQQQFDSAKRRLELFRPALPEEPLRDQGCPNVLEALYLDAQTAHRLGDLVGARASLGRCVVAAPRSCIARKCKNHLAQLGE